MIEKENNKRLRFYVKDIKNKKFKIMTLLLKKLQILKVKDLFFEKL